jgi:pimeloyl-ACP methyl ester carboxylesterase
MAPERATRWRHRIAIAAGPVIAVALAGATYQGVINAVERRAFPHPGRLVGIGGHQLHLLCTGDGGPTVVLEAAAGVPSAGWAPVQARVAEFTRVCSYDRAGLGWSESESNAFTPAAAAEHLHALLAAAETVGPFVLVGHGLGASLAELYASRFAGETSALVLIDAPWLEQPTPPWRPEWWEARPALWPWMARVGLLRLTRGPASFADGLSGPEGAAVRAFFYRPDHLRRAASELARWDEAMELAASAPPALHVETIHVSSGDGHRRPGLVTEPAAIERTVAGGGGAGRPTPRDRR